MLSNLTMKLTESFQLLGDSSQLDLLMRSIQDHKVCAALHNQCYLIDHHPCLQEDVRLLEAAISRSQFSLQEKKVLQIKKV